MVDRCAICCGCNLSALLTKYFPEMAFRTAALECLTEIAGLVDLDPRYNTLFQRMFMVLVKQVLFMYMAILFLFSSYPF